MDDDFVSVIEAELRGIQDGLLAKATQQRDAWTFRVETYAAMKDQMAKQAGFYLVPWHDDAVTEREIKDDCKATIRCFPLDCQDEAAGRTCFYSGRPATHMAIFARAY